MEQPTPKPETELPENVQSQNQTIAEVTAHFQKQLNEEKKKYKEEIARLSKQIEEEKQRHIQDIRDILTAGKIQIPTDGTRTQTEEDKLLNEMRAKFNI